MPDELTPEILFSRMPKAFQPEKAVGVDAVIQFDLSGAQGGQWVATIKDGKCSVEKGKVENPKLTLMADAVDYVGIFTGKVNPMSAFGEGKIKLKGDLGLAMKLMNFFKMS
jgi:putative sterol carrier protein